LIHNEAVSYAKLAENIKTYKPATIVVGVFATDLTDDWKLRSCDYGIVSGGTLSSSDMSAISSFLKSGDSLLFVVMEDITNPAISFGTSLWGLNSGVNVDFGGITLSLTSNTTISCQSVKNFKFTGANLTIQSAVRVENVIVTSSGLTLTTNSSHCSIQNVVGTSGLKMDCSTSGAVLEFVNCYGVIMKYYSSSVEVTIANSVV